MGFDKVSVALMNFGIAARELAKAFDEVDEGKLNEYISDDYPFQKSYDEMYLDIDEWCRASRVRIGEDKA